MARTRSWRFCRRKLRRRRKRLKRRESANLRHRRHQRFDLTPLRFNRRQWRCLRTNLLLLRLKRRLRSQYRSGMRCALPSPATLSRDRSYRRSCCLTRRKRQQPTPRSVIPVDDRNGRILKMLFRWLACANTCVPTKNCCVANARVISNCWNAQFRTVCFTPSPGRCATQWSSASVDRQPTTNLTSRNGSALPMFWKACAVISRSGSWCVQYIPAYE